MAYADGSTAVRHAHARQCLLLLRDAPAPLTVARIAESTGLSRPTVDAVLADLAAAGSVRIEAPSPGTAPGRPARHFTLEPGAASVLAIDVGERSVRCVLADAVGTVLASHRAGIDAEPPSTRTRPEAGASSPDGSLRERTARRLDALEQAVRTVHRLAARDAERTGSDLPAPTSLGVAVPGILDPAGQVTQSLAVEDLVGVDLAGELSGRLGCPVAVENDIKLAAYAEHHLSPAPADIALVQIGHRISVAMVLDGRILQGHRRLAGELGTQRGMRWTSRSQRGRLQWSTGDEAAPLLERAAAGDREALAEIDAFCAEIAPRLASLALTVDPERLVIGGGLSRAGSTLLDPLRHHVHRLLTIPDKPELVAARHTTDGALLGALGLAFEHGSIPVTGIPDVPAPWQHLTLTTPDPRPEGTP